MSYIKTIFVMENDGVLSIWCIVEGEIFLTGRSKVSGSKIKWDIYLWIAGSLMICVRIPAVPSQKYRDQNKFYPSKISAVWWKPCSLRLSSLLAVACVGEELSSRVVHVALGRTSAYSGIAICFGRGTRLFSAFFRRHFSATSEFNWFTITMSNGYNFAF